MAEQDALLEALQTLTEQISHAILGSCATPGLPERAGRYGVVWNAWHAVRMSYRSPLSPSRAQGVDGVPGFDAQVRQNEWLVGGGPLFVFVVCLFVYLFFWLYHEWYIYL